MTSNNSRLFNQLLDSTEIRKIDFKRDQYLLDNDILKSEFVKDILCMANAPGDDGYILLGVKAEKGRPRNVAGISQHHDGSDLEEIVTGIIEEPIQFEYQPLTYKGRECAILHIPKSKAKPHWPKRDYGVLKKHVFYTRRSSGNREASIQEIREMCVSTIHISDIARRKTKSSPHVVDELSNLSLDEREPAMHNMLKTIMPKVGLAKFKITLNYLSSRHWCSMVSSEGKKLSLDYAVFMYPWNVSAKDIWASRYNAANVPISTRAKRTSKTTRNRLQQSTLIHISYKKISTKPLERKSFDSNGYWFANEIKLDWGKVMKWEDAIPRYIGDKAVYETKTKYEFFLEEMISKEDLQERISNLLSWVDENLAR
jgi:hypothetical protein